MVFSVADRVEAVWLRSCGVSCAEIEARFGVSRVSVWRWSKVLGVDERCVRSGTLSAGDREEVLLGIERGESNEVIGARIGVSRSTVWREISRNGGRDGYSAVAAEQRCRRQGRRSRLRWWQARPQVWMEVQRLLGEFWSPEQIAAELVSDHPDDPEWWVSHESIYQAIYLQSRGQLRKELTACLRTQRQRRRAQGRHVGGVGAPISGMVNISQRPKEADDRAIPGHWEGDLIIGKNNKSQVATLVERTTRFGMLIKVDSKDAVHVADRISAAAVRMPQELLRSITWDQGTEMADHARFSVMVGAPVFFCDPHAPWQRGTNENWNGLVRQWLPKATDLSVHSQDELDEIARMLNGRPRKTLGWQKPGELFNEILVALTT